MQDNTSIIIADGVISFGYLVKPGEDITFAEFSTRILLNADVRNPKTAATVTAFESELGMIQKDHQGRLHWQYAKDLKLALDLVS